MLIHSSAWAADLMSPQLYDIITETKMPHLEENLRSPAIRERRCLGQNDLWSAFPILHHAALRDCRLQQESRQHDALSFALACAGGHGTTGRATWRLGNRENIGTLDVKLGGKNMTFYQRVIARPLGQSCRPDKLTSPLPP
jgi:hypothetical protein